MLSNARCSRLSVIRTLPPKTARKIAANIFKCILGGFKLIIYLAAFNAATASGDEPPQTTPNLTLPSIPILQVLEQLQQLPERIPAAQCTDFDRPGAISYAELSRAFENLNFRFATSMEVIPGTNNDWAISLRDGMIMRFVNDPDTLEAQVILDIEDRVVERTAKTGNWGLQSAVFHPDFNENGALYLSYNTNDPDTGKRISVLSKFTSSNGLRFNANSEAILIRLVQDTPQHGIGQLAFGPDGYLYVAFGDGGVGAQAQNLQDLRGKILRLDVDGAFPYQIPASNPFIGTDAAEEVYVLGFRNPWRFSFDTATDRLYSADVGESSWEEVDQIEAGENYGWPIMEGNHCVIPGCDRTGLHPPAYEYSHDQGCAIIGGHIYRGNAIAELQGKYVFGDYCSAELRAVDLDASPPTKEALDVGLVSTTGFGQDNNGELFTLSLLTGNLHQVSPASDPTGILKPLPSSLSEAACFSKQNILRAKPRLVPYEVNTELWSDGADKRRWMSIPRLSKITIDESGDFIFPIGSVLIKEFAYDNIPFETRLFVRHEDGGWGGYSYEWRDDGSDADLLETGKTKVVGPNVSWDYPSPDQCNECHSAAKNSNLGPEILQLNRHRKIGKRSRKIHQLKVMKRRRLFDQGLPDKVSKLPALASIEDTTKSVAIRARSYLHANCSHCHLPNGPAPVSIDFRFDTPINQMNICRVNPATEDFGLSEPFLIDPGNPANSIIPLRMGHPGGFRMPPLATSLVDQQALDLIKDWIADNTLCETASN